MKHIKPTILWIVLIIIGSIVAGWYFSDYGLKSITWKDKKIEGQINELILYNTFPDNELLVVFKDTEFILITKNYMGAYAFLSQVPENETVIIKYCENGFYDIYVKELEVII